MDFSNKPNLPSPRLLAIHRAVCEILHLSEAVEYIDDIVQEMEEECMQSDWSSDLGRGNALFEVESFEGLGLVLGD